MEREARILGGLAHPVLTELYELALDGEPAYMVFGALEGLALSTWVEKHGGAKWGTAQEWLSAILDALALAHARGFVHHDLRPEVVFVDPEHGRTQLLGFGRTRVIGGASSTLRERATPPVYWAPELFVTNEVDPRSDLYGAAAVTYYALTAHAPIEIEPRAGMATALQRILANEIRPPSTWVSSIPRELDALLLRALAHDPNDRFQSAREMLEAVHTVCDATLPVEVHEDAVPIRLGDLVDARYKIRSRLGSGGTSRVFLAHDLETDRPVALKSLKSALLASQDVLVREAEALGRVSHINVVGVYGVGSFRGAPYMILEHLPGRSMRDEIRHFEGRLPKWFALAALNQVGRGLTAVHRAGLVHGDVKPANILVGPGDRVSLVDFGLVRDPEALHPHRVAGTPAYLAPERLRGEIDVDLAHRIDVYALGVMAYEMLVGKRPFRDSTSEQLMAAQLWTDPPLPSSQDSSLSWADAPIMAGLAKSPSHRTPSAEELVRELLHAALDASPERPFRVLIADDEDGFAELVQVSIEGLLPGARCSRAADGAEAYETIEREPFDVVLLDLDMPSMNGLEVVAQVRASMSSPPPIACMTAVGDKPDLQLLAALGVGGFLTKPVQPEEIACLVMRLLEIGDTRTTTDR